jgi:hypothetical protein
MALSQSVASELLGVRRRAPRLINPLRKRALWRSVCVVICAIETTNL